MSSPFQLKDRQRDVNGGFALTAAAIAAGVIVVGDYGFGSKRQILLKLTNTPFAWASGTAGSQFTSLQLGTFPKGRIKASCVGRVVAKTTSTIASTLISGATVNWGIGSVTAAADTLVTTQMNFMPGSGETVKTFTSSTVLNGDSSVGTGFLAAASGAHLGSWVDGTVTPASIFLNFAVAVDASLLAAATMTVSGHIFINFENEGVIDALTSPEAG